jgi:rsbT co-antagonist protein RsbR
MADKNYLSELVTKKESAILDAWIKEQLQEKNMKINLISEKDLKQQSAEFLNDFQVALRSGELTDIFSRPWETVRSTLEKISESRSKQGFTTTETIIFILSLKQLLFTFMVEELGNDPKVLNNEMWTANVLLDKLGLFTSEAYTKSREKIIKRQQEEMLELSTPVVKLWDQVVALPLIGTLDSVRSQVVMETLLQEIVNTSSAVAIIDITGVPTVDTLVAQHLTKTVTAARLMGVDCIICGIRPQIAQTMVQLGVSFENIITRATLADALKYALNKSGFVITKSDGKG